MHFKTDENLPIEIAEILNKAGHDAKTVHNQQLRVFVNNLWQVVIRYDSAQGFAHIDQYYLDGKKIKKKLHLKLNEALNLADEDIKENWKVYQMAFLEGK
ncbi:MAG: hypothetical protein E3K40_13335 [Candidatus Brocadia sp.]|nr:hypothetical protein [Candidatus Brocadia sp.]